jgi:hypothetical protein
MRQILLALAFLAFATGCGSSADTASAGAAATAKLATLPATLEGELSVSVGEGDTEEAGEQSQYNFGDLTVDGEVIAVEISGDVLAAAGVPADADKARVRATLSGKSQFDAGTFVVSRLEKL